MPKHILTNQEQFEKFLEKFDGKNPKEEPFNLNEGILGDITNAIKTDISNYIDDEISGKNKTQRTIKEFAAKVKEYLTDLRTKFGMDAIQREGSKSKDLIPIYVNYRGERMPTMAANVRELTDSIVDSLKNFYVIKDKDSSTILNQLQLKTNIVSKFEQLDNYRQITATAKSFDNLVSYYGYTSFMENPAIPKMRAMYDSYIKQMDDLFKQYYINDFLNYFKTRLDSEIDYSLLMQDDVRESDFLIKTREELNDYYKRSRKYDFKPKATFYKDTDNIESIQKSFLLEYTIYKAPTQLSSVSRHLLSWMISAKSEITKIDKGVDDYFIADYIEDADHIVRSLISVDALDIRKTGKVSSLNVDLKHNLFMNALLILVGNYRQIKGLDKSKNGFYIIDDWKTGLKDMFEYYLVTKKEEFNTFFSDYGVSVAKLDTLDIFSITRSTSKFQDFISYLNKNLTESDFKNSHINTSTSSKQTVNIMGNPEKDDFDPYDNNSYYNYPKKTALAAFFYENTSQRNTNTISAEEHILESLTDYMGLHSGSSIDLVTLLKVRDEYLGNNHFGELQNGRVPNEIRGRSLFKTLMYNIIFVLYYAYEYLGTNLKQVSNCVTAVDYYRLNIGEKDIEKPLTSIDVKDTKEVVNKHYKDFVTKSNNTLIDVLARQHFDDLNLVSPSIEKVKESISQNRLLSKDEIDLLLTNLESEIFDSLSSFSSFENYIESKSNAEYIKYSNVYKKSIQFEFLGKSLAKEKINIKIKDTKELFNTTFELAKKLIEDAKIKLSDSKREQIFEYFNIIYNIPLIYNVLLDKTNNKKQKKYIGGQIGYQELLNTIKVLKLDSLKLLDYKTIFNKLK